MVDIRYSFGLIVDGDSLEMTAIQTRPTPEQQVTIDAYRAHYEALMGFKPEGLHYIKFPGVEGTIPVWIPLPT
jgi:hypothetical protein